MFLNWCKNLAELFTSFNLWQQKIDRWHDLVVYHPSVERLRRSEIIKQVSVDVPQKIHSSQLVPQQCLASAFVPKERSGPALLKPAWEQPSLTCLNQVRCISHIVSWAYLLSSQGRHTSNMIPQPKGINKCKRRIQFLRQYSQESWRLGVFSKVARLVLYL